MNKKNKGFGKFLQAARERKHLSLRAVEKVAGISNAYLSQLESGKIQQPSPVTLHKLSELYEISYATLMELVGYPVPGHSAGTENQTSFSSRIGPITEDEEEALAEYLAFLRLRRNRDDK